jgi:predicted metal-dependent peptidase
MQREIIDRLSTKVDWKKVLRYFVKTSRRANKRSTVKRLNKRYAYIHAGKKVTRRANIAISIDQSGSVSDGMLAAFFSELNKLAKLAEFTVIPFDDKVFEEKIYVWKQGENKKWERVLCGGTNFDAPTEYVNKNGFDGHIVLTDMLAPKPKASKCQRMWMTSTYYATRPYFKTNERILAIDAE